MTAGTDRHDAELAALRRPFRIGMLACLAALICIGGLVAAFGTGSERAAGIAERWLVAVGDSTREGLRSDAEDRLAELGGGEPGARLILPEAVEDEERAFEDLRVGRDTDDADDTAVVPFELRQYEADDPIYGVVLLARDADDDWLVVAIEDRAEADIEIERPERPGLPVWLGTAVLGAIICVGCALATRAATPKERVS